MKKTAIILAFILLTASTALASDILLTSPQTDGGPSVLAAIEKRGSATQEPFLSTELSIKDLSTLLWAATGRNRGGSGWTVPFALGKDPYVEVYVLLKSGAYHYDKEKNMLKMLADRDFIARSSGQKYVATAPCVLVFAISGMIRVDTWGEIAAGGMAQNVYFAAEALGLKTRYVQSFNRNTLIDAIQLSPIGRILCIMPIGKQ